MMEQSKLNELIELIIQRLEVIETRIAELKGKTFNGYIDNSEFKQLMKIGERAAQGWRDRGIIAFSKISGKIYYKIDDVEALFKNGTKHNA